VPAGRVLTAVVERQTATGQAEPVPRAWRWSEVARAPAGSEAGATTTDRPVGKAAR